jgi:O-Antigen ligase
MRLVFVILAVAGMFALSYFAVGQEMNIVVVALGMVLVFLICFFSVKISLAILIFSMLLSPEITMGQTEAHAINTRMEDMLLFTMTMSWMIRMAIFKDLGFMLKTSLNRPMIIYSVIAVLSTTLGALRGNVLPSSGLFFALKIIEYFFLFNVVINNVQTEKEIENILTLLLIVSGIICVYGLAMAATGSDVSAPFESGRHERNTLSGYLVLMGSVAAGVLMNTPNKVERTLLSILDGLIVIVLLFSISRSGWVAAIVSVIVLFICSKQKNIYFALLAVMVFCLAMFLPSVVHERVDFTFHQFSQWAPQFELFGIKFDTSTSARIFAAQEVIRQFSNHVFLGYGLTGFYFIDGQFFRTLIELGTFGLAAFVWLLVSVHAAIRKTMKMEFPSSRIKGMTIGFYAGFWGLIAHAFTANTFMIVRISEPFWCLAGLMVILVSLHQTHLETQHELSAAHNDILLRST